MRFKRSEGDPKRCVRCGSTDAEHEWHCAKCGAHATELTTCGCGECVMPVPPCKCAGSIGLFCPAERRRLDDELVREHDQLAELNERLRRQGGRAAKLVKALADPWEEAEYQRLLAARTAS